ncbi:DUF6586 family protein [Litoribrevibacter albus]|uniref:Uncharacterized protein n=1 Tax=Litoribrevibacter albus TaxID=1473156 RepID=A0AA37W787_9GAMM|nr:DUF6586 family protein [Litoribrevibacter albus]GLQ31019.1 hypothetical protein GCM10007876_14980 [Litoribrevibacter albus]
MADKASNWVPLTNEKLYFAQVILDYLKDEQAKESVFSKNRIAALEESAVSHLYNAYIALLCELAAEHNVPFQVEQLTLNQLNEALMQRDDGRREIAELMALLSEPGSWLSRLHQSYRNRFVAKQKKSEYKGEEPELLSLVAIDASVDESEENLDLLGAYQAMKQLVDQVRSYRLED